MYTTRYNHIILLLDLQFFTDGPQASDIKMS